MMIGFRKAKGERNSLKGRLRFIRGDIYKSSYEHADGVVCYLFPGAMTRLVDKFSRELPPGHGLSVSVSHFRAKFLSEQSRARMLCVRRFMYTHFEDNEGAELTSTVNSAPSIVILNRRFILYRSVPCVITYFAEFVESVALVLVLVLVLSVVVPDSVLFRPPPNPPWPRPPPGPPMPVLAVVTPDSFTQVTLLVDWNATTLVPPLYVPSVYRPSVAVPVDVPPE